MDHGFLHRQRCCTCILLIIFFICSLCRLNWEKLWMWNDLGMKSCQGKKSKEIEIPTQTWFKQPWASKTSASVQWSLSCWFSVEASSNHVPTCSVLLSTCLLHASCSLTWPLQRHHEVEPLVFHIYGNVSLTGVRSVHYISPLAKEQGRNQTVL